MSALARFTIYAAVITLSAGCSGKRAVNSQAEIPVVVETVNLSPKGTYSEFIGIAEEEVSSAISFPVNGTVERIYVNEGQRVVKGAVLAELNTHSLQNAYTAAKAQLDQAEDAMQRLQMLYDNESLAEIKYVEIKTDLEKARSMEAIAKKNLDDSRLLAPFSGIIGKKRVEAGENVLPNQPVLTLLKTDQINVRIAVPEKEINSIRLQSAATIKVAALGDELFEGVVTEKSVVADPLSHTYDVLVRVKEPGRDLLPGMVTKTTVREIDSRDIISVPTNVVQVAANGEKYIWCVVDGRPVKRTVRTGGFTSNGVEIVAGIDSGDQIVTEGYQNLREGVTILIR